MKIRNINPAGAVHVAALDMRLVGAGEVVDVGEDVAALLLIQTANWELGEPKGKAAESARDFAEKVVADHLAELAEISVSFQRKQQEFQEDLKLRQNEETSAVLEKANKAIFDLAKSEHWDLILQEAVSVSSRIDVTDKVIKKMTGD